MVSPAAGHVAVLLGAAVDVVAEREEGCDVSGAAVARRDVEEPGIHTRATSCAEVQCCA